jgi:hypothetical protein
MPWINKVCIDAICGTALGFVHGMFGASYFSETETSDIGELKQLALSIMQKSPNINTDPMVCEGIRSGRESALDAFSAGLSPESVAMGVGVAAQLVCRKSFVKRFSNVLTGACLNLTGC